VASHGHHQIRAQEIRRDVYGPEAKWVRLARCVSFEVRVDASLDPTESPIQTCPQCIDSGAESIDAVVGLVSLTLDSRHL